MAAFLLEILNICLNKNCIYKMTAVLIFFSAFILKFLNFYFLLFKKVYFSCKKVYFFKFILKFKFFLLFLSNYAKLIGKFRSKSNVIK